MGGATNPPDELHYEWSGDGHAAVWEMFCHLDHTHLQPHLQQHQDQDNTHVDHTHLQPDHDNTPSDTSLTSRNSSSSLLADPSLSLGDNSGGNPYPDTNPPSGFGDDATDYFGTSPDSGASDDTDVRAGISLSGPSPGPSPVASPGVSPSPRPLGASPQPVSVWTPLHALALVSSLSERHAVPPPLGTPHPTHIILTPH